MKEIKIVIRIDELSNQIATAKSLNGYKTDDISHQLELLGVLETLVEQQREKIKTLGKWDVKKI